MLQSRNRPAAFLLTGGIVLLTAGLGFLLGRDQETASLMAGRVAAALPASGVENPVTAVLLNFRGYDTLLEVTVLLAALVATWSLGRAPRPVNVVVADEVLLSLGRILLPLLILVSGYLVWTGARAPGGAFQAGALLGAAGVLLQLMERAPWQKVGGTIPRLLLSGGLLLFLAVAAGVMLGGRRFLQYPTEAAGGLMLLIEIVASVSIGLTLALLFAAGRPEGS